MHIGHIFAALACLLIPVSMLAPKGLAVLFAVAAVAVLVVEWRRHRRWPALPRVFAIAALGFAVVALAGIAWSPAAAMSFRHWAAIAGTLIGGLVLVGSAANLDSRCRETVRRGVLLGGAVAWLFLLIEIATNAGVSGWLLGLVGKGAAVSGSGLRLLNPAMVVSSIFLWIWGMALDGVASPLKRALLLAIPALALTQAEADTPVLAVLAGLLGVWIGRLLGRRATMVVSGAVVAAVMVMPLLPGLVPDPRLGSSVTATLSHSAQHRILIWQNTAKMIAEQPWFGHGFDFSRMAYSAKDKVDWHFAGGSLGEDWGTTSEPIPLHPHNAVLQVWLELGAVGAVAYGAILVAIVLSIARGIAGRARRNLALATFATAMVPLLLSFGAWQSWWLAVQWMLGALAVVLARGQETEAAEVRTSDKPLPSRFDR